MRERRQPLRAQSFARKLCGPGHDLGAPLPADPPAAGVRDEVVVGSGREPRTPHPVDVLDDHLGEVRADKDYSLTCLGLCVDDLKLRTFRIVQTDLAYLQVAKLADPEPCAAEQLADDAPADVAAPDLDIELSQVVGDG